MDGRSGERGASGVQDEGTHVHPWLIHVDAWQKPPQYCNYPPIKINKQILKNKEKDVFYSFSRTRSLFSYQHIALMIVW